MRSAAPLSRELLDDPAADPAAVRTSLGCIARANRWLGGRAALRFALRRLLAERPAGDTLTLLDVGTGAGDLPLAAARWGRARGLRIVPIGLDRHPAAARLAADAGVPTAVADAGRLPFRPKSVDLVLVSQVAHHLAEPALVRLLRDCDGLARVGVILSDLRRSVLAAAGFRVVAWILRFDRNTRADGVTSIRRGFAPGELAACLRSSGLPQTVARRPGYRLVAAWRTG